MNSLWLTAKLPVADWVEKITDWLTNNWAGLFNVLQVIGQKLMNGITNGLVAVPPFVFIIILTLAAFVISKKRWGLTLFTLIGLLYIYNQGLWQDLMNTLTLVLLSSVLSIIIGVPTGIWMAKSDKAKAVITPILDFMQTMPGFVYLIPAVAFFGIGIVPGLFASIIFALPPTVRMTNLGIRDVPKDLTEAADSFGSTGWQKLTKVELPLAKGTIMAGINQTTMLALSMVVIASMIGAPGLGRGVLQALQRAQVGVGFVNGLALVVLAIIIDRFTQYLNQPKANRKPMTAKEKKTHRQKWFAGIVAAVVVLVGSGLINTHTNQAAQTKGTVNLAYINWDSEVASTNVIAQALRQKGYTVDLTPLDNAVAWESVAKGQSDAMVSAWLPNTHKAQYNKYKKDLVNLGPNLAGAKVGFVVPKYMTNVNSMTDLTDQANKTITGIEPGAGEMAAAETTLKTYPNLKGWKLSASSSGAMTAALSKAYAAKQPIVVTGWSPHWMFSKYYLKYLKDPKGTMGKSENINTMVRKGLKQDQPEAYKILDNFHWTTKDMESVMLKINKGEKPQQAAKDWIKANQSRVNAWFK
ncbi:glycine betaine L-proline ABC transporter glycine betaine L-proline-binding permease protein [Agrilactobacillus composti DSM 18527 = JCM 14202]|uniref:Glycine betaine L-proline ABC transporter glycine betaine L-proline-binding permease protein n=1 Tax=Agrilactobacillus composti DSM 18527 = JCM 14202 TaxID=1423734 RepID=X0PPL7_9LACO|nr:ABC transporter permease/substrate binding protein [Agrilactobacillus composti]KRM31029.1 glycine betaine L-proline ABC transporter glycine betaine L-proline-binding permease protein [Agrilactobacillus composti DSM 18527 = JCM 14202]GAF39597.1 glycine betaine ABC transport system, permease protein OpuAB [Agrilactobacillus composti DSM 18527 = JCM 14202]